MLLTGKEIKRQMELGNIKIEPFDESQLNPNSYNLRLGNKLLVYKAQRDLIGGNGGGTVVCNDILDAAIDNPTEEIIIPEEGLVLLPGILYLGTTVEWTETHNFIPCIDGRSSIGRLGILVHYTAGFGD